MNLPSRQIPSLSLGASLVSLLGHLAAFESSCTGPFLSHANYGMAQKCFGSKMFWLKNVLL
jgi:hypothetical protein